MDFVVPRGWLNLSSELASVLDIVLDDGEGDVINPLRPDVSLRRAELRDRVVVEVVAPDEQVVERWDLESRAEQGGASVLSEAMQKRISTLKRVLFALICSHRRISRMDLTLYSYRVVDGESSLPMHGSYETHTLSTSPPMEVVISVTVAFLLNAGQPEPTSVQTADHLLPLSPFEECVVLGGEEPRLAQLLELPFFEQSDGISAMSLPSSSTILVMKQRRRGHALFKSVAALSSFLEECPES